MALDLSKYGVTPAQPSSGGSFDLYKYGVTPVSDTTQAPVEQPGYFHRVANSYKKEAGNITDSVKKAAQDYTEGTAQNNIPGQIKAGRGILDAALESAGGIARASFTPILEAPGIKSSFDYITKKAVSIPAVKNLVSSIGDFAHKNPQFAREAQNIFDIVSLGYAPEASNALSKEGKAVISDVSRYGDTLLSPSEQEVQKNIIELFHKSVKPTAKKTIGQADAYDQNILSSLKSIKENVNNLNIEDATGELVSGRTPESLGEFSQSIDQTKQNIFKRYDALAKQANKNGAQVDLGPVAEALDTVISNKALSISNPEVIKYAQDLRTRLIDTNSVALPDKGGVMRNPALLDTETAQAVVQNYNKSLEAFYRNPTYESASKAAIDAGVVNNIRQALDKSIEGATGEQYQALKNQYGALKSIENDVVRASMRDARKNTKGLLDYTDILTGGQMLSGVMSLNPAMFTKGAVERGIKEYIKFLNDPNRAVKNIFESLDDVTSAPFQAESSIGKAIQNPSLGLSVKDVTKNIHPEDVQVMTQAIDYIRGGGTIENMSDKLYKSLEALSPRLGFSLDQSPGKITNALEDLVSGTKKPLKGTVQTGRPFKKEK